MLCCPIFVYMNTNAFDHENTPFGAFGEFEPVPADFDWAEYDRQVAEDLYALEDYMSDEADAAAEAAYWEYLADQQAGYYDN